MSSLKIPLIFTSIILGFLILTLLSKTIPFILLFIHIVFLLKVIYSFHSTIQISTHRFNPPKHTTVEIWICSVEVMFNLSQNGIVQVGYIFLGLTILLVADESLFLLQKENILPTHS